MITRFLLFIAVCLLTSLNVFAHVADTTVTQKVKPFVIVLDAGHGGKDTGKSVGSINEKDIALIVIKLIGAQLERDPKFKVIYTRKTDVFVELSERAAIANRAKADFFVSVHCNAAAATQAAGNETWILGTSRGDAKNLEVVRAENAVILLEDNYEERYVGFDPKDPSAFASTLLLQEDFLEESIDLAARVQSNFQSDLARKNRGVKQANFAVLRLSYMPSVLIETGFLTNTEERAFLNSPSGQQQYANAIFNGIMGYYKNRDLNNFEVEPVEVIKTKIPEPAAKKEVVSTNKDLASTTRVIGFEKPVKGIVYRIQLAASSKKIEPRPANFNKMPMIKRVQVGQVYKYFSGSCTTQQEANELLSLAKQSGYEGAFIVKDTNGNISLL